MAGAAPPDAPRPGLKVGILALQGEVSRHAAALRALGATPVEVRGPADLAGVDGLVLPGGESTTMSKLLDSSDLRAPLAARLADGMPALGTCAGMILLATEVLDGRADQQSLGTIDVTVRRNAFGRQVNSFEADLDLTWDGAAVDGGPFHAVFIRAPVVEAAGPDVEVLARVGEHPVLARQGPTVVASFHPELTDDLRLHRLFLSTFEEN
ncbi:pyridoxal 5'-phosphate synthase glutaminase subunit PdxT [Iamia majanohamensis]|uniref:Pyridoxal 5'-phosphate synthase subunit PdxT n=1 Tax=Iamia majanohamensis TaxID=467976 RepID=A0AAE9Y8F2_9ACTN|nr:pyridoxal 5'-phosphate synthase glutaminase subunit PdxT [Iamia majanohamensis]WCO68975.1 pyridoxal 5'-phosphate synthase glutaminase subunit PdxT [Iamia majanohamensis]